MRRVHSNGYGYPYPSANSSSANAIEEENEEMVEGLKHKITALKSLSIDIGTEVRSQNQLLSDLDNDFDSSGGFLSSTMSRLTRMSKAGHNRYILYLILFSFFVFFVIYILLKLR